MFGVNYVRNNYKLFLLGIILFSNCDFVFAQIGTVFSYQKISNTQGNFSGVLDSIDTFGASVTTIGDLNSDGIIDLAIGASNDDDGGTNKGAVWILFMNPDGTVNNHMKISQTQGSFTGTLDINGGFGGSVEQIGDLDGDGVTDIAVGEGRSNDGGTRHGAIWILFLNTNGTVKSHQKISDTFGGFTDILLFDDRFGQDITCLGDLDGDGITDIVSGSECNENGTDKGAVWILFLNTDGTVKSHQKINDTNGGFTGTLNNDDRFGFAVSSLGDLDGDGVIDIAVGARRDDDGGINRGAVWILFLDSNGTVKSHQKISSITGNFSGSLVNGGYFGAAIDTVGDLNCDNVTDIIVGQYLDDDGGTDKGAVWILFLNLDGTVKNYKKISSLSGNFNGNLDDNDIFGSSVCYVRNFDTYVTIKDTFSVLVTAPRDDDGGTDKGAVWLLKLYSSDTSTINPIVCGSFNSPSGKYIWTSNGIYFDTIPTQHRCDSIITINLTINPAYKDYESASICEGETFIFPDGDSSSVAIIDTSSFTSISGCDSIIITTLNIYSLPNVNASIDITITRGSSTTLNATGGINYNWYPPKGLSCTNCQNPVATPLVTTTYYVTVTDANGCSNIDSVIITVLNETPCNLDKVFIPNGFSPNNDGENDILFVYGDNIDNMTFKIFNRWGGKVFESKSTSIGWDGKHNHRELNSDVFVYFLEFECNGETYLKKGNITLLK